MYIDMLVAKKDLFISFKRIGHLKEVNMKKIIVA